MQPIIHPKRLSDTPGPPQIRLPDRPLQANIWNIIIRRNRQMHELRIGVSLVERYGGCPGAEDDECWR